MASKIIDESRRQRAEMAEILRPLQMYDYQGATCLTNGESAVFVKPAATQAPWYHKVYFDRVSGPYSS